MATDTSGAEPRRRSLRARAFALRRQAAATRDPDHRRQLIDQARAAEAQARDLHPSVLRRGP